MKYSGTTKQLIGTEPRTTYFEKTAKLRSAVPGPGAHNPETT